MAKTDQSTEEVYFPFNRTVLRTRDTTYKDRQWVFDAQLDKAFSIGATDHLQRAPGMKVQLFQRISSCTNRL